MRLTTQPTEQNTFGRRVNTRDSWLTPSVVTELPRLVAEHPGWQNTDSSTWTQIGIIFTLGGILLWKSIPTYNKYVRT